MAIPFDPQATVAARGLTLAGGRYRLVEQLGRGGFGCVWLARDTFLQVDVAVKEILVQPGATPEETAERVERAAWEARNAARMRDHPNIVTIHDVVVERGAPWIVMQYVPGRSLAEAVNENGPVSVAEARRVAAAVLAALGACHAADVVHRDVKPENILLGDDGSVLLTDFGIAKHSTQSAMTATDVVIGSVAYIAPERARGHAATPASDLFSLGVTLYYALEGIAPFDRGSGMASLAAVLMDDLPEPGHAGELAPLIKAMTNKDPAKRPTAEQAGRSLNDVSATATESGPTGPAGPDSVTTRHNPVAPPPTRSATVEDAATSAVRTKGFKSRFQDLGQEERWLLPSSLLCLAIALWIPKGFVVDHTSDGRVKLSTETSVMDAVLAGTATGAVLGVLVYVVAPTALLLLACTRALYPEVRPHTKSLAGILYLALVMGVVGFFVEVYSESARPDWISVLSAAARQDSVTAVHVSGGWVLYCGLMLGLVAETAIEGTKIRRT